MFARERCPQCGAKVDGEVRICAACGYALGPRPESYPWWWLFGLAGALAGAGVVIAWQIYREKRRWCSQDVPPARGSSEFAEELMDF